MKTFRTTILFIIATIKIVNAQVDTTDWFPMQTGNYWEYWDNGTSSEKLFVTIEGDTILDNGEEYKIFRYHSNNWLDYTDYYLRKADNCKILFYYGAPGCINKEQILYNFCQPDSLLWESCTGHTQNVIWSRTVLNTEEIYFPFYQNLVLSKQFSDVTIDTTTNPIDTVWDAYGLERIVKGLGLVESILDQSPWYQLVGAIIDGVEYGTVTEIDHQNNHLSMKDLHFTIEVFPNPFNSQTNIYFTVDQKSTINIEIYNMIGEKLKEFDKNQIVEQNIISALNMSDYPSGMYLVTALNNNNRVTKKIINLK